MAFTKINAAGIGSTETVTLDGLTVINDGSFGGNVSVGGTLTYEDVTNIDSVGLITARAGVVVGSGITLSKDGDGFFTGIVTATSFAGDGSSLTGVASTDNIRTNTNATFLQNINVSGTSTVGGAGAFGGAITISHATPQFKSIDTDGSNDYSTFQNSSGQSVYNAVDNNTHGKHLFQTAGTERMRIDSSGLMGLGTNSPSSFNSYARNFVIAQSSGDAGLTISAEDAGSEYGSLHFSGGTTVKAYIDQQNGSTGRMFIMNKMDGYMAFGTNNTERLRIANTGAFGLSGENYGSSGQVLTSQGSGSTPTWTTVSGTTINNNADNRLITGSGTANTLEAESTITYDASLLNITSTTRGLGLRLTNTGNEYTNIQFSAARTSADNALGILNAKWNNSHEVAAIYLTAGDDTTNKDDGKIKFYTSAASGSLASRLEILNDGDVKVSDGDLVIGTSGHGIDFSATGGPTNGSGTSELLDDYEEGTFTPSNVSAFGVSDSFSGKYVKVGALVHFEIQQTNGTYGPNSGKAMSGLPFQPEGRAVGSATNDSANISSNVLIYDNSYIYFTTDHGNQSTYKISGTYRTAS